MERSSGSDEIGPNSDAIGANVTERMSDRPRPDAPQLDDLPLPVIDTDQVTGVAPPIDDV